MNQGTLRIGSRKSPIARFAEGSLKQNLCTGEEVETVAVAGATPARVTLVSLLAHGDDIAPIPRARHVARLEENLPAGHLELAVAQQVTILHKAVGLQSGKSHRGALPAGKPRPGRPVVAHLR